MSETYIENISLEDLKREMRRMASEGANEAVVRNMAELAILGNPHPVSAIFDFVKEHFPYIPDPPTTELLTHPRVMANNYYNGTIIGEDCDGHAMLDCALLQSIGLEARMSLLDTDYDYAYNHAICEVKSPVFGWLSVDTSSWIPLGWVISSPIKDVL